MFWPFLTRRAPWDYRLYYIILYKHFLVWKETQIKPERLNFLGYNCLYHCWFLSLIYCWAKALSQTEHKSELWHSRVMCVFPYPCTWSLKEVIFTLFLFANTNFILSFSLSLFLCCFYVHVDRHRSERTPIMHSLKFFNLATVSFREVTQKNQCWETTIPGLNHEESLRAKTVGVCPQQSQEHPLNGSINFCC